MRKFHSPSCESCSSRFKSVFCDLPDEEISQISDSKHCNFYLKGQSLFNEGNHPDGLFCINKGRVKLSQTGFEGKEQIIRLAKDGDVMGYRSLISGETYSASATVMEDSRICIIPKSVFFDLLRKNINLTGKVMKLLADDLKFAQNKITNLAQKPVIERLAEALIMLKEYYGMKEDESYLNITITREEIANIVGTATETTIRLLSELRKEGILELEGKKIKILKNDALLKLANLYD
ncbi:MAG TPA: Crp/Fnr family transcriptional regulator [Ignavibacteria bacterium]|nr:Crp/Fnr family transcriptional regulator [Ignavibacteria bacterium]HRB00631.1 Crp/Fnr family transcriptional regulator [Ignavibacteria bacterium]